MEFNKFVPITARNYVRLLDGTPYGLVVSKDREPVGVFVVVYGLDAFRKHCYIPDKNSWLTLGQIEQRRQEIVGESGRWEDIPLFARNNPWRIICLSLTEEQLNVFRKDIADSKDFKFDVGEEKHMKGDYCV